MVIDGNHEDSTHIDYDQFLHQETRSRSYYSQVTAANRHHEEKGYAWCRSASIRHQDEKRFPGGDVGYNILTEMRQ